MAREYTNGAAAADTTTAKFRPSNASVLLQADDFFDLRALGAGAKQTSPLLHVV